ncbi:MAG: UvrD-helicase domain-containing protein [Armatimonadetes bacterium]|nr:UvrD-helicase domain-containing protein [Candidatus Hippobium faecium]
MEELLKHLNDFQRQAVEETEGPVLVLAGAGSGKTRVLTYRIAKIIKDGVRPSNILAVTFTNKAAGEIKERLRRLCGEKVKTIWAGTFHSVCVRMLREYGEEIGISKKFTIYDEYAQKQCVKQAVENLKYDGQKFNPAKIINLISNAKEKLVTPENYALVFTDRQAVQVGKIYGEYMRLCRENQALDFDDLINCGVELLQKSEKVRRHYQEKFRYVHVDEFQDINYSQYQLVSLLARPNNNIFCVGDDDQSIYG